MRTLSIALAAALACAAPPRRRPPPGEVALTVEGKVDRGPAYLTTKDLSALPRRTFRAREPRAGQVTTFEGVSLAAVLSDAAPPLRTADIAVVRGRDGTAAALPLARIRELKPILADRADGRPIAEWAKEAGVPAESFLLAWPNLDQPGLDTDPRARSWWVSGVATVGLEAWLATYGKALRLSAGATDEARRGAEVVAIHCLPCHSVRESGGRRGPDLTGVLKSKDRERFAEGVRRHALDTGLPAGPTGDTFLREIAAFLASLETSEPPVPEEGEPREDAPPPQKPPPGAYPPPRR
jgi:hypothetical protein